jgi:hypothetical protein
MPPCYWGTVLPSKCARNLTVPCSRSAARRPHASSGRPSRTRWPAWTPAAALEAPAHEQRAGACQREDQAQAGGVTGVPLGGVAGPPGGGGVVRAGRGVVGVALLLGEEDGRALRGRTQARAADRGARRGDSDSWRSRQSRRAPRLRMG